MAVKNRIGVVGSGPISCAMIDAINESSNGEVMGIWGRRSHFVKELAKKKGVSKVYGSLNEVFEDDELDTVYIATPNAAHYEQAMAAIEHGKNVIVEKTAFMTADQANRVFDAAEKQNVFVFEAVRSIHEPNFQNLKNAIKKLGKIHGATLKYQNYSKQYSALLKGEKAPRFDENHGGGTLRTIGIYPIYAAIQLFGAPFKSFYFKQLIVKNIDLGGTCIFEYKDYKVTMLISKINLTNDSISEIYGENGTLRFHSLYDIRTISYRSISNDIEVMISEPIGDNSLLYEITEFSEWILMKNETAYREQKSITLKAISIIEQALNGGT
ncbi:Gfo/Idh/MocA family protein [Peribacillus simplex]|uniref:Gfo/Idh/MocA family protein n=1 Tax=Peribacillus simplex TaxID=1478 RepID=UPI0024C168DB|nr:Gfo/Idh/MocA family oxidoreductase [Peribacillus simplex]WHY97608.1 Gfo/Idh/MocA family oxidoreductase [Peribacillus simplex]